MNFDTVKEKVEECLRTDPYARESDIWLLLKIWKSQGVRFQLNGITVNELITPETTSRIRRLFQSNGQYLASVKTQEARNEKENKFKEIFKTTEI